MYSIRAIVLAKQIIRDNQIRILLFTLEYGKITVWGKKTMNADIGSQVEVLIERKKQENTIVGLTLLSAPKNDTWNYKATLEYLTLFQMIKECLPEGSEQRGLYRDIHEVLEYLSKEENPGQLSNVGIVQLFILMKARILKLQGFLNESFFKQSSSLGVIFNRLDLASMKSMMTARCLSEETLSQIEFAINEGIHTYKHRT